VAAAQAAIQDINNNIEQRLSEVTDTFSDLVSNLNAGGDSSKKAVTKALSDVATTVNVSVVQNVLNSTSAVQNQFVGTVENCSTGSVLFSGNSQRDNITIAAQTIAKIDTTQSATQQGVIDVQNSLEKKSTLFEGLNGFLLLALLPIIIIVIIVAIVAISRKPKTGGAAPAPRGAYMYSD